MTVHTFSGINGSLPIALGWRGGFETFTVYGGPYDAYPGLAAAFGVCVRAERVRPGSYDLHLPIDDFSVPNDDEQVRLVLQQTLNAAITGQMPVYVGCQGGWGRTGLFLALLAKACGVRQPVQYVREHYTPKAVETPEQLGYVERLDVSDIHRWVYRLAWRKRLNGLFPLLRR